MSNLYDKPETQASPPGSVPRCSPRTTLQQPPQRTGGKGVAGLSDTWERAARRGGHQAALECMQGARYCAARDHWGGWIGWDPPFWSAWPWDKNRSSLAKYQRATDISNTGKGQSGTWKGFWKWRQGKCHQHLHLTFWNRPLNISLK